MRNYQLKLSSIKQKGELNPFLYDFLSKTAAKNHEVFFDKLAKDSFLMNEFGVKSNIDLKNFWFIYLNAPIVTNKIIGHSLSKDNIKKISKFIFSNLSEYPIDSIENFFKAAKYALKNSEFSMFKISYPIPYYGQNLGTPYNIKKWTDTMRGLYYNIHKGLDFPGAFDLVTKDWSNMEKKDFKHWADFYSKNEQFKYKTAQEKNYYADDNGAPLVPFNHLQARLPSAPSEVPKTPNVAEIHNQYFREDEIKEKIRSVISRLQSAEKIVTDPEVQKVLNEKLDMGLDKWLETLHYLKRKIQTVPIKSASSNICEDLIIKEGNRLINQGYKFAGFMLKKIAQEKLADPTDLDDLGPEEDIATPEVTSEKPIPQAAPLLESAPLPQPENIEENDALKEFIKRLNFDDLDLDDKESFAKLAQQMPSNINVEEPEEGESIIVDENPETVGEKLLEGEEAEKMDLSPGSSLNREVTVAIVIKRLETVDNILRNREIPRQLAMIDIEMDILGIAPFFPTLAEAHRSALESHSYMITRIDDILSKLRGSLEPGGHIDLTTNKNDVTPSMDGLSEKVKENLKKEKQKEEDIKNIRKTRREQQDLGEIGNDISVVEDLNKPVNIQQKAPVQQNVPGQIPPII